MNLRAPCPPVVLREVMDYNLERLPPRLPCTLTHSTDIDSELVLIGEDSYHPSRRLLIKGTDKVVTVDDQGPRKRRTIQTDPGWHPLPSIEAVDISPSIGNQKKLVSSVHCVSSNSVLLHVTYQRYRVRGMSHLSGRTNRPFQSQAESGAAASCKPHLTLVRLGPDPIREGLADRVASKHHTLISPRLSIGLRNHVSPLPIVSSLRPGSPPGELLSPAPS